MAQVKVLASNFIKKYLIDQRIIIILFTREPGGTLL